jgi:hypothetical protein
VIITTASPLPSDARWDDMGTVNDGTLTRVPAEASHAPGGAT